MSDAYIGNARDIHIGYSGRNSAGGYRDRCYGCHHHDPLTNASPIWGEYPDRAERTDTCDQCGVVLQTIADVQQAAHDEQQTRWARSARPDHVIEMGCVSGIRCRVY